MPCPLCLARGAASSRFSSQEVTARTAGVLWILSRAGLPPRHAREVRRADAAGGAGGAASAAGAGPAESQEPAERSEPREAKERMGETRVGPFSFFLCSFFFRFGGGGGGGVFCLFVCLFEGGGPLRSLKPRGASCWLACGQDQMWNCPSGWLRMMKEGRI